MSGGTPAFHREIRRGEPWSGRAQNESTRGKAREKSNRHPNGEILLDNADAVIDALRLLRIISRNAGREPLWVENLEVLDSLARGVHDIQFPFVWLGERLRQPHGKLFETEKLVMEASRRQRDLLSVASDSGIGPWEGIRKASFSARPKHPEISTGRRGQAVQLRTDIVFGGP